MGSSDDVIRLYNEGYDCAQCILKAMSGKVEFDEDTALRTISSMGMGLLEGSICGALLGALAVIGLKYGSSSPDPSSRGIIIVKRAQLLMEFRKKYKGITCPEIMGVDVRKDEDNLKAFKEGIYEHFCPKMASDILEILNRIIE
jgi:C_GCAxxG_C_C family probable redox protein